MLEILYTFDDESSNLSFVVLRLAFANSSSLIAVNMLRWCQLPTWIVASSFQIKSRARPTPSTPPTTTRVTGSASDFLGQTAETNREDTVRWFHKNLTFEASLPFMTLSSAEVSVPLCRREPGKRENESASETMGRRKSGIAQRLPPSSSSHGPPRDYYF